MSQISRRRTSSIDELQPGRTETFHKDVGRIRGEAAGIQCANIGNMDKACAPSNQFALVMSWGNKIHVRRMKSRRIRVIEQENVAFIDVGTEATNDRFTGFSGAGEMVEITNATHEKRSVSRIKRHHEVVPLIGDGAAGYVFECNDGFFDDTK